MNKMSLRNCKIKIVKWLKIISLVNQKKNAFINDINEVSRRLNEKASNIQSIFKLIPSSITNFVNSNLNQTWSNLKDVFTSFNTKYKEHLDYDI